MLKLYYHEKCRDVAMEIRKSFYVKEKDIYKVQVTWWNIGPHAPWCMHIRQKLVLSPEQIQQWRPKHVLQK